MLFRSLFRLLCFYLAESKINVYHNDNPSGPGEIYFRQNSECFKSHNVTMINGTFVDGILEGMATIQFQNMSQLVTAFHIGAQSGLTRLFQCRFEDCDFIEPASWNIPNWLSKVKFVN